MGDAEDRKPRPVVRLRVVANNGPVAEDVATKVSEFLESLGYEIIEQTPSKVGHWEPDYYRVFLTVR